MGNGVSEERSSFDSILTVLDSGGFGRGHFSVGPLHVYVRRGFHILDGTEAEWCFDIANVSVDVESRRKGVFKRFLSWTEVEAGKRGLPVFVESILNSQLYAFLRERGYRSQPHTPRSPNLFKRFPDHMEHIQ
jgi:GNAT superfamily N-acetyltransferase